MSMKYDVLIVGAGPSGLFCAYELLQRTGLRIALLDAGRPYEQKRCPLLTERKCAGCRPCSTLTGEGGAAFFHAGKMSFYPAGSGLRELLGSDRTCLEQYGRVQEIFAKYNVPLKGQDRPEDQHLNSCRHRGFDIKYYCSVPVEREKFQQFIRRFGEDIRKGTNILYETEVLTVEKTSTWSVKAIQNGSILNLETDKLVIAVGEYGFRWWNHTAEMLGVCRKEQQVDIGVRIECPSAVIEEIWPYHKDLKAKVTAPDGSELRTYCVLKNGRSVYCNYGDYIVLDGIPDIDSEIAGITIFNRLGTERLGGESPTDFAISLLKRFYQLHRDPICIGMADFLGESPVDDHFACTLPNGGQLRNAKELPEFIHRNLVFGIRKFNELIPGLEYGGNCVLMPVMDNLWSTAALSESMESSIEGLYITGDATGQARGIMQACVTGLLCGDGIANKVKGM